LAFPPPPPPPPPFPPLEPLLDGALAVLREISPPLPFPFLVIVFIAYVPGS